METQTQDDSNAGSRKRCRDDPDSPESGRENAGVDSAVQDVKSPDLDDSKAHAAQSSPDEPEAKRIHADLLSILDDSDELAVQGLDSVIRSFEEEILFQSCPASAESADVTSVGDCSQPDLGYLLEASDDELGLPPTSSGEQEKGPVVDLTAKTSGSAAFGFGDLGFEDQIPGYDSFDFEGLPDGAFSHSYNDAGDFVNLGGLFNYSDDTNVSAEISGLQWQRESLSAL